MKVLLIWEEVPENTVAYVLEPGKDDELIMLAEAAHGHFVNAVNENEATDKLNELLYAEDMDNARKRDFDMERNRYATIPGGPYSAVYISGFIL